MRPQVLLGDGVRELRSFEPRIDLLLTDLPSGETQAPFDRRIELHTFCLNAWSRMTDRGNVILFASNIRFVTEILQTAPSMFKYDLVWKKSIAGGFLNAGYRPLRAHEFILVFGAAGSTYNPQMRQGLGPVHSTPGGRGSSGENFGATGGKQAGKARARATDRYPWSVLEFASVGTRDPNRVHPQQKPVDLLRYLVRTYSNPDDLVVDPFAGSGSTGVAALAEERRFIGWDSDPRFGSKP